MDTEFLTRRAQLADTHLTLQGHYLSLQHLCSTPSGAADATYIQSTLSFIISNIQAEIASRQAYGPMSITLLANKNAKDPVKLAKDLYQSRISDLQDQIKEIEKLGSTLKAEKVLGLVKLLGKKIQEYNELVNKEGGAEGVAKL